MIRLATKEDISAYVELLMIILQDMELDIFQTQTLEQVQTYLKVACQVPGYRYFYERALVAEEKGVITGLCVAYPSEEEETIDQAWTQVTPKQVPPLFTDKECVGQEWYVDSLVVHPNYRQQGLGKALLEAQIQAGKEKGQAKVGLNVEVQNKKAQSLYSALGFQKVTQVQLGSHQYEHRHKLISSLGA